MGEGSDEAPPATPSSAQQLLCVPMLDLAIIPL